MDLSSAPNVRKLTVKCPEIFDSLPDLKFISIRPLDMVNGLALPFQYYLLFKIKCKGLPLFRSIY